jgi:hypothetical protein
VLGRQTGPRRVVLDARHLLAPEHRRAGRAALDLGAETVEDEGVVGTGATLAHRVLQEWTPGGLQTGCQRAG